MYGISTTTAGGATAAGATTLAKTGVDSFWMLVTAVALVMVGAMLLRLRPKKEF